MKKYFFSALAFVAFAGSAMASNNDNSMAKEIKSEPTDLTYINMLNDSSQQDNQENLDDPKRPCTVYVTIHNSDGTTGSLKGEGGEMTWSACGDYQKKYLAGLQERNIKFTDDDVKVIWG